MGKDEMLEKWLQKGHDDLRSAEYLSTMHHPTPDEVKRIDSEDNKW